VVLAPARLMPAHANAYARLYRKVAATDDRARQDQLLDEALGYQQLATMWDADQWGLDPDNWCLAERNELAARGGRDWPIEP
jgi:hypothetical protein